MLPLEFDLLLLEFPIRLDVLVGFAIAANCQRLDAEVNTNHLIRNRQRRYFTLDRDADEILPALVLADRCEFNITFQVSMEDHRDAFEELGDD